MYIHTTGSVHYLVCFASFPILSANRYSTSQLFISPLDDENTKDVNEHDNFMMTVFVVFFKSMGQICLCGGWQYE